MSARVSVDPLHVPHLHLGSCVRDQCAAACPRRGRPAGPDGRCGCATCLDPHTRYGVSDVWDHPGWPVEKRIVASVADCDPSEIDSTDGSYDTVVGLLADRDWCMHVAMADAMGLVGDWGTEDVQEAVAEALNGYRLQVNGGAA